MGNFIDHIGKFINSKVSRLTRLFSWSSSTSDQKDETPDQVRLSQHKRLGISVVVISLVFGIAILWTGSSSTPKPVKEIEAPIVKVENLATPLSNVAEGDVWTSRVERIVAGYDEKIKDLSNVTKLQDQKIVELQKIIEQNTVKAAQPQNVTAVNAHNLPTAPAVNQAPQPVVTRPAPTKIMGPQNYPGNSSTTNHMVEDNPPSDMAGKATPVRRRNKLIYLTTHNSSIDHSRKDPSQYLPAGTILKAVNLLGVVAGTGVNASQQNQQPMVLRLVDNGNLPGGLKSIVKDARVIASCYGDASAERVVCRLKTLSWRDPQGRNIEREIQGWISDSSGLANIGARLVDKSSQIAREAFGAGLLSAASNFFKFQAQESVFPASPFGQTRAMPTSDALMGAGAAGMGNAFDKLAAYSISKAESLSSVAIAPAGLLLDLTLMSGVDISSTPSEPQVISTNVTSHHHDSSTHEHSNGDMQ